MPGAQLEMKNIRGAPIDRTRLAEHALVCLPPRTAKMTVQEWNLSNDQRRRNVDDQQQLADLVLAESQKIIDQTDDRTKTVKDTSDQRLSVRIGDVEFNKHELELVRKEINIELEAQGMYKVRLQDCIASLEANALNVIRKCLILRDGRLGIDLVADEVEMALQTEITTVVEGTNILKRVLEQLNEQMRRLRSVRYLIDRDLQYKQHAIDIDKACLSLKPTALCLSVYEGHANMNPTNISNEEYKAYSTKNIIMGNKEINSARPIRVYIDTLLKQVKDDLWAAYRKCNFAFKEQILRTKTEKVKFEDMYRLTSEKVLAMQGNISQLRKALASKEGYIGLAHTRLGKRAQRVGTELVACSGSTSLYRECEWLRHSVGELQHMLHEASSSLRYLVQTQLQLQEDINVKMNTLKIDEVDCMTLRATMDYHEF